MMASVLDVARFRRPQARGDVSSSRAARRVEPGTLQHVLLERYLLFTERNGTLLRGQVHHEPYPAQRAEVVDVHDELVAAAGLPPAAGPPHLVHSSPGVDVEVFALEAVLDTPRR